MKKPNTTVYRGIRVAPDRKTVSPSLVYVDDKPLDPRPSQKMINHSPDGFNWGYGGSGPAQLALAMLLDYYGAGARELTYYQAFKWAMISKLPQECDWRLTGSEIETELKKIIARIAA